jgi:hypothetical protein
MALPEYDFRPLDGPMPAAEARARRAAILNGRSVFSAMDIEHWAFLLLTPVLWLVWLFFVIGLVPTVLLWWVNHGPSLDWYLGTALTIVVLLGGGLLCVLATRLCIIPPRWGRWVRMHRFAEVNGLTFIRMMHGVTLPPQIASSGFHAPRIFDAFSDPETGFMLGNWVQPTNSGRGVANWRAFILVPVALADGPVPQPEPLSMPYDGFDVTVVDGIVYATKFPSVRMRRSETVRRMFATAASLRPEL